MGQSRNEDILENMLGAQNELGDPQSRIETLLMEILDQGSTAGSLIAEDDGNGNVELKIGR